jgi:predicted DNA binding protein
MPIVDARVRVHHPCPYCDLSVRFPTSLLLLWCDNRRDTFLLSSPDGEELRRLCARVRAVYRGRVLLAEGTSALVELPDFEWPSPPSVTGLARRGGVWVLPPVVYAEGRETYRLIAPTRARLNRLIQRLRRLGEVEILSVSDRAGLESVRDYPAASAHFFEGLSERQLRSLVVAHDAGLLEIPARSSWAAVARAQGMARSTFGEHLRKAQLRLVRNSYSLLRTRMAAAASPPVVLSQLRDGRASVRGRSTAPRSEAGVPRSVASRGGSARRTRSRRRPGSGTTPPPGSPAPPVGAGRAPRTTPRGRS